MSDTLVEAAERPSSLTLAAFAAPSLPISALGIPLVIYLPEYYANVIGLELAVVGLLFMAVRIIDIAFDPVLGSLIDRTRTRVGRFRPWLIGGAPLLMGGVYLGFSPPQGAGTLYLALVLLALHIPYSILHIGHMSWGATLSGDYDQRSRIYGWWQAANVVGIIIILLLPALLAARGLGHEQVVPVMGWFIIALIPLCIGIAACAVPERASVAATHTSWREGLMLLRRPDMRRLLVADLAFGLAPGLAGATFLFFFREVKDFTPAQAALLLLANFIAALVGAPVWARVARWVGKHRALALAGLCYAVGQLSLFLIPPGSVVVGMALFALVGLAFSAPQMLLRAMMADAGDAERMQGGKDRTGLLYALVTAVSKLGYALSVGIGYGALALVGFVPRAGAENGAAALAGLQLVYLGLPALLSLTGAFLIHRFPIDRDRHGEIRQALAAQEADRERLSPAR